MLFMALTIVIPAISKWTTFNINKQTVEELVSRIYQVKFISNGIMRILIAPICAYGHPRIRNSRTIATLVFDDFDTELEIELIGCTIKTCIMF